MIQKSMSKRKEKRQKRWRKGNRKKILLLKSRKESHSVTKRNTHAAIRKAVQKSLTYVSLTMTAT